MSGRVGERLAELTASGTSCLFWMNGNPDEIPIKIKSTRPVMTSVSASGPPRKGTWVALKPALTMKRSAAQWVALPTPAEAKLRLPSFALATSSCTVLMPFDGATSSTFGTLPKTATPAKSAASIVRKVGVGSRCPGVRGGVDQQSVAIGVRFRDRCLTKAAAGAATIFYHDGLPEL